MKLEVILQYGIPILTTLITLIIALLAKDRDKVQTAAIDLIVKAENTFEKNEGAAKMQQVLRKIYTNLPWLWRIIPQAILEQLLQHWYNQIKPALNNTPKE